MCRRRGGGVVEGVGAATWEGVYGVVLCRNKHHVATPEISYMIVEDDKVCPGGGWAGTVSEECTHMILGALGRFGNSF